MNAAVDFTPEERRTLEFAPLWMLSAVVGRYRGFDLPTLGALDAALASAENPRGATYDVVVAVRGRLLEVVAGYEQDGRPIVTGLVEVARLLTRLPESEAREFRSLLVDTVGMGIAKARGPFGVEATREDLERLELAAEFVEPTPALGFGIT